jgi:hypothetical protein
LMREDGSGLRQGRAVKRKGILIHAICIEY